MRWRYRACIYGCRLSRPGQRLWRGVAKPERHSETTTEIRSQNILVPLPQPDKRNADAAPNHRRRTRRGFGLAGRIRFFARACCVVRRGAIQIAPRISPQPAFSKKVLRKAAACKNRT